MRCGKQRRDAERGVELPGKLAGRLSFLFERVLGMYAEAQQGDGHGAQHPETDSGKRVPAQVHGAKTNRERPDQGCALKYE